jgi:predicted nucleotidyltransferase
MIDTAINHKDIYDIAEIRYRLNPVFKEKGVKKAVLFGSYAKGEARPQSDVDIMVDSGLRGLEFMGLVDYVREVLQKDVDLIDVHYIAKDSSVEQEIEQTGVQIYGDKNIISDDIGAFQSQILTLMKRAENDNEI